MIKIDKDVPLPNRAPYGVQYPLGEMGVGDSFFVASGDPGRIQNTVLLWAKRNKMKFTTRRGTEDGQAGLRVWRIK